MVNIEFTDDEIETLKDIFKSYLSDLRMEIADTDQMDFREFLKAKEETLNNVIKKFDSLFAVA